MPIISAFIHHNNTYYFKSTAKLFSQKSYNNFYRLGINVVNIARISCRIWFSEYWLFYFQKLCSLLLLLWSIKLSVGSVNPSPLCPTPPQAPSHCHPTALLHLLPTPCLKPHVNSTLTIAICARYIACYNLPCCACHKAMCPVPLATCLLFSCPLCYVLGTHSLQLWWS